MSDPLQRYRDAAAIRGSIGVTRQLYARPAAGDPLIDLASNDYLGLSRNPRIASAAATAALTWGAGSTGSRVTTGTTALHAELETTLADFLGARAALVFSSAYQANLAVLSTFGGPNVLVVADEENHASTVDGCRLAQARVVISPHRDAAAVDAILAGRTEAHALIVTDAVFSVHGDLAPLADLHAVARRHGAMLVVNEAHSLGVLGPGGRGAVTAAGLAGEPDVVRTVSLSAALGAQGGAVAGVPEVVGTLVDVARPFIFDAALAPASAGAALAAIRLLVHSPELATAVRARADELAWTVKSSGLTVGRPDAAILTVPFGDARSALHAQKLCAEQGVRVACYRPPAVADERSCIRLTARANLSATEVTTAGGTVAAVARSIEVASSY